MLDDVARLVLLDVHLVNGRQLHLLRLVGEGAVTVGIHPEQLLLDGHRKLLHVLVIVASQLQQFGNLEETIQKIQNDTPRLQVRIYIP